MDRTQGDVTASFSDVTPGTFQQFTTLLLERLALSQLPEMAGMIRLHGRWTDPGRASGKYFFGKVVDDGGAHAKVEISASLVTSRGVIPGQAVVLTGRVALRVGNYGVDVSLAATDIQLTELEEAAPKEAVPQGRMTLDRLRSLSIWRSPFPEREPVVITLIQSASAVAQVASDCMAELTKLGGLVRVQPVHVNMLDPVAIAESIRNAGAADVIMIIRGGGASSEFEVFDDPRVVTAMAQSKAHRVVGLGHTGNATLLDLVADWTANTPAQAGGYVRERVQQGQRLRGEAAGALGAARERENALKIELRSTEERIRGFEQAMRKAAGKVPAWVVIAAFVAGGVLSRLFR